MATGGHGIRFQYDYTHDQAGLPGSISGTAPRWLRLTRTGDTITGYDSSDGTSWHRGGSAHLAGLPTTVYVGLFATSPTTSKGSATRATASFDHIAIGHGAMARRKHRHRSAGLLHDTGERRLPAGGRFDPRHRLR
jgi:hypothetical protein